MKLLAQGGIVPIVVTGRDSPAVRRRVADLGLVHAAYGAADKLAAAKRCWRASASTGIASPSIGDDWPDLPLLQRAAFACAPPRRPRRGAGGGASRHRGSRRLRRGARVLRPAARRRRPLRRAAARPPALARWRSLTTRSPASGARGRRRRSTSSFAGPEPVVPTAPWHLRLLDLVSAYLPLADDGGARRGHLVAGAQCADRRAAARGRAAAPRARLRDDGLRRPALRRRRHAAHPDRGRHACATIPTTTRSRSTRRASARSPTTAA